MDGNKGFTERVNQRIRERHAGKSVMMMAEESGLSYATLTKVLSGNATAPRYATLVALATYLDCTVGYLTDGIEAVPEAVEAADAVAVAEAYRSGYREGYADAMNGVGTTTTRVMTPAVSVN